MPLLLSQKVPARNSSMRANVERDESGNIRLKDIGKYLQKRIKQYFSEENIEINLKYIDPSYIIRSVSANTNDGLFSAILGQNAVHAAMAGKTDLVVSIWHGVYCQLPISLAIRQRKTAPSKFQTMDQCPGINGTTQF